MLETPQERVKLLKAGIDVKTIERLYIIFNNLKILHTPLLFELVEMPQIRSEIEKLQLLKIPNIEIVLD